MLPQKFLKILHEKRFLKMSPKMNKKADPSQ